MKDYLRSKPVYKKLDLVKDPNLFLVNFDLIVCRNVIIYFNNELQNRVFDLFYKNLNEEWHPPVWVYMNRSWAPFPSDLSGRIHFIIRHRYDHQKHIHPIKAPVDHPGHRSDSDTAGLIYLDASQGNAQPGGSSEGPVSHFNQNTHGTQ